jgi:hypothetical protein
MNIIVEETPQEEGAPARERAFKASLPRSTQHSKPAPAAEHQRHVAKTEKVSTNRTRGGVCLLPCTAFSKPPIGPEPLAAMLNHARQEAKALAAATSFPDLFLPCLLQEKTHQARAYAARQEQVWKESRDILCMAV